MSIITVKEEDLVFTRLIKGRGKEREIESWLNNDIKSFNSKMTIGVYGPQIEHSFGIRVCVNEILQLKKRLDENDKVIEKLLEENMKLKSNESD